MRNASGDHSSRRGRNPLRACSAGLAILLSGCSLVNPASSPPESNLWQFQSVLRSKSTLDVTGVNSLKHKENGAQFSIVFTDASRLSLDSPCGITLANYTIAKGTLKISEATKSKNYHCSETNKEGADFLIKRLEKGLRVFRENNRIILSNKGLALSFKIN